MKVYHSEGLSFGWVDYWIFMVYFIIGIHSILSVALVVLILLHSGKGGVSGIFGGGMSETFSGTSVIEKNLTRVTIAIATAFFITTGLLVFVFKS